jgi:hypothetical protein
MNTVRQRLLEAIALALGGIHLPTYETDAGSRVFLHRDALNEPLQAEELPAVTVRIQSETISALTAAVHEHVMLVEVSGHDADNRDDSAGAWRVGGDIHKAMGVDPTFGGLSVFCQPQSCETNAETRGKKVGTCRHTYEIRFRTSAWDPETVHTAPT